MESSGLASNWTLPPLLAELGTYDNSSVPLRFALGSVGQGLAFHSHEECTSCVGGSETRRVPNS